MFVEVKTIIKREKMTLQKLFTFFHFSDLYVGWTDKN